MEAVEGDHPTPKPNPNPDPDPIPCLFNQVSAEAVEGDNEQRWAEEFSLAKAQEAQRLLEEEEARKLEEARRDRRRYGEMWGDMWRSTEM